MAQAVEKLGPCNVEALLDLQRMTDDNAPILWPLVDQKDGLVMPQYCWLSVSYCPKCRARGPCNRRTA